MLQVVNVTIVLDPAMRTPPPCEQSDNRQSNGAMERYSQLFEARGTYKLTTEHRWWSRDAIRAHA